MDNKVNIENNFRLFIIGNVVKGHNMDFEPISIEKLDEIIKYCKDMKFNIMESSLIEQNELKSIFQIMESIVNNTEIDWNEKYDQIFSNDISKKIFALFPEIDYYDPDSGYEDDILAFYRAVRNKLKSN
jgi:hypothetical protein